MKDSGFPTRAMRNTPDGGDVWPDEKAGNPGAEEKVSIATTKSNNRIRSNFNYLVWRLIEAI
ncbi:MAG TPA: hypothetical protein VJN71_03190 [Nitrososphaerales archaeon]|nr:hypothetical protein [Nitrososphaerales archaeon]